MFSIAHLSDLHATPVRVEGVAPLLGKRLLGWVKWRLGRSRTHAAHVLEALIDDLHAAAPDQVVVTGDLTNVSLEAEFEAARAWLRRIGSPERVSVVPGNHDAYVRVPREFSWQLWSEFMTSDPDRSGPAGGAAEGIDPGDRAAGFPTLRVRGPVALVGVCSARPSAPFLATGAVGAAQLERLERMLESLANSSLCRIVLIHHPPAAGAVSRRRALVDAAGLRGVLRRAGADLVLHGHTHRTWIGSVPGPRGPIPVVGVRSSSHVGTRPEKRAQYHLYQIESDGPGFRVRLRTRGYDPESGRFGAEGERVL